MYFSNKYFQKSLKNQKFLCKLLKLNLTYLDPVQYGPHYYIMQLAASIGPMKPKWLH